MGSKKFSLDVNDVRSVLKNAAMVGFAAFITTAMNDVGKIDFGTMSPLIVPVVTLLLDSVLKWTKDNSKAE